MFSVPTSIFCQCPKWNDSWGTNQNIGNIERKRCHIGKSISEENLQETQNHYIEGFELPPLSVFMDAVIENATVKRAQSQVEQIKNQYRIEKRNWWNYFRLNGNYAYGRYNVLNDNSDSYNDWYQSTTASSRHTFNIGATFSVGLGDLFNRPLRLKTTVTASSSSNIHKKR